MAWECGVAPGRSSLLAPGGRPQGSPLRTESYGDSPVPCAGNPSRHAASRRARDRLSAKAGRRYLLEFEFRRGTPCGCPLRSERDQNPARRRGMAWERGVAPGRSWLLAPGGRPQGSPLRTGSYGESPAPGRLDVRVEKRHNVEMLRDQKRTTIYFESVIHRALRLKSIETERSLSDLVNEAVRLSLAEDAEDLAAFEERASEENLSFEAVVKDLKARGRI